MSVDVTNLRGAYGVLSTNFIDTPTVQQLLYSNNFAQNLVHVHDGHRRTNVGAKWCIDDVVSLACL